MSSSNLSGTAMSLTIFCVLSILGGTSVAMDEQASSSSSGISSSSSSSSSHGPHFSPLVDPRDQIVGGKRAYTYRSEYKRLPIYQFGLGKRWVDDKVRFFFNFTFRLMHDNVYYTTIILEYKFTRGYSMRFARNVIPTRCVGTV